MKTQSHRANSAQSHTQKPTALFNIFWNRETIAIGVSASIATRYKRRHRNAVIKFAGFDGGAL